MSKNVWKIGAAGLVGALVLGGGAWASHGPSSRGSGPGPEARLEEPRSHGQAADDRRSGGRRGGLMSRVARADLVLVIEGEVRNVRVDRGVVRSVAPDAIALEELDGTVVRVPLDDGTRIAVNGVRASATEIDEGHVAMTIREAGEPARAVRVFDREGMPPGMRE